MKNHNEKVRDMARSVLPSTKRKFARDCRAIAHRKIRHATNQTLHQWANYDHADEFEGFADRQPNRGWGEDQNIKMMVSRRRDGDKLSVVRWAQRLCETKLAHLTPSEQYNYFKNALPDNTIGRHALGHIETSALDMYDYDGAIPSWFIWDPELEEYREETDEERKVRRNGYPEARRQRLIEKCREILEHGQEAALNREIKRSHPAVGHYQYNDRSYRKCEFCEAGPRLLHGIHDINLFVEEIMKRGRLHQEAAIVEAFFVRKD